MKPDAMKTIDFLSVYRLILLAPCALLWPVFPAGASTLTWTNAAGDLLWSTPANWSPNALPGAGDSVWFGNGSGFAKVAGAVNNVVGANVTVSNLFYSAITTNGWHTTLINPGVTLTVDSSQVYSNENALTVLATVGLNDQMYATIRGANASLVIGVPEAPKTNFGINVAAFCTNKDATISAHRATLDLSGLDNFIYSGGYLLVAGNGGASPTDQPSGTLLLAKTNLIIASRSTAQSTAGTIRLSHGTGNATGQGENLIELGQENTIRAEYVRIGGSKAKFGGAMRFRGGLIDPTLKLRGPDGTNRMALLTLGDNWDTATGVASTGVLDLSGGTVDGRIETIHVGRTFNNGGSSTSSGSGIGTLTFTAGTIDATTVYLGCQGRNNLGVGTGILNVCGTASLLVDTLNIGGDAGVTTGTGSGTLNVDGGTVMVSGKIVENDATSVSGCDGSSTINITNRGVLNLQPPGDLTPGNLTVDTLNFSSGALTNYGALALSAINLLPPATDFTVYPGQTLSAAGTSTNPVGTLMVNGNLVFTNATWRCDLDSSGGNDQIVVSGKLTLGGTNQVELNMGSGGLQSGSYLLATYGTGLAGDSKNLQVSGLLPTTRNTFAFDTSVSPNIVLTVNAAPSLSLTWTGDGLANVWDVKQTANWSGNTEKFCTFDTVTFDDTGSTTPAVSLVGALTPSGVTVDATRNYTFSGTGRVTGGTGLTKLGTGTLRLGTSNDYTGTTTVGGGTLVIGDGGTNGSVATPILNDAALVFDRSDELLFTWTISGSGSLTQVGSGGLRLHTPASYAGATTVEAGSLRISGGNNRLPTTTVLTLGSAGATGKFYMGITTAARDQQLAGLVTSGLGGSVVNGAPDDVTAPIFSTLTLNTAGDFVFAGRLGGDGINENNLALVKLGDGRQTLSGINTYTNSTTISAGTLALAGSGAIAGSPLITVNSGATFDVSGVTGGCVLARGQTLAGVGTVVGPMTVGAGATLSPGTSIGTLTITGSLALSAGSSNVFEVNTDTLEGDRVSGLNQVTYGGTLVMSPSGTGAAFTNGSALKIFDATSYTGAFAAIVPPVPGPGLAWDTSALTVSGTLKIVTGVSTTRTNIALAVIGNTLNLSWPIDHTGWRLEAQTNSVHVGLGTNWLTVPGSDATNSMSIPIDRANEAVFYRLAYP